MPADVIDVSSSNDERPPIVRTEKRKAGAATVPFVKNPEQSPIQPPSSELKRAISSVRLERLQDTMLSLCRQIPGATEMLANTLLTPSKSKGAVAGTKRKMVTRWVTCANCKEEFDVANNDDDEGCTYHDGEFSLP